MSTPPFCSSCGHPSHYCNTAGGCCGVTTASGGQLVICRCPSPPLPDKTTEVEKLAQEIADVPRAFIAHAFGRLEEVLPERRKPLAREVASTLDETILDFMTKERKTVPR
jgi:hypothetical protein